jgi:hypothetical protein
VPRCALQDWDQQQKEKRERLLAGWKPEDEEGEQEESGGDSGWAAPMLLYLARLPGLACLRLCQQAHIPLPIPLLQRRTTNCHLRA